MTNEKPASPTNYAGANRRDSAVAERRLETARNCHATRDLDQQRLSPWQADAGRAANAHCGKLGACKPGRVLVLHRATQPRAVDGRQIAVWPRQLGAHAAERASSSAGLAAGPGGRKLISAIFSLGIGGGNPIGFSPPKPLSRLSRESGNLGISVACPLFMPGASSGPPLARGRRICGWVRDWITASAGEGSEAMRDDFCAPKARGGSLLAVSQLQR